MSDAVWVAAIAAVPATLAVVLGFMNRRTIGEVKVDVNSRMTQLMDLKDELIAAAKKISFAEGVKQETDKVSAVPGDSTAIEDRTPGHGRNG